MFKKSFKIATHNAVSQKDKKKLKKDLAKFFDQESIDYLFIYNQEIFIDKVQGQKMFIYTNGEIPLFVDSTTKGDFFPTSNLLPPLPLPRPLLSALSLASLRSNSY